MAKTYVFKGPNQAAQIAEKVLVHSMRDPELAALADAMVGDPEVTREQLYGTAFAQGVVATLAAIKEQRLIMIDERN